MAKLIAIKSKSQVKKAVAPKKVVAKKTVTKKKVVTKKAITKPVAVKKTKNQHGTILCYRVDACRCRPCKEANNSLWREYYHKHKAKKAAQEVVKPEIEIIEPVAIEVKTIKTPAKPSIFTANAFAKSKKVKA